MYVIHLTYQTSQLSLAILNRAQNAHISLQLGNAIQHKAYFIIKCWISQGIYYEYPFHTIVKLKNYIQPW